MESITLTTGEVLTAKEIPQLLRQIDIQNQIIEDYEKQVSNLMSHIISLGKEIDIATEEYFNSPYLHRKEMVM